MSFWAALVEILTPLREGLLCEGLRGERHFLCGPRHNGCTDSHVLANCGGVDGAAAPTLVHQEEATGGAEPHYVLGLGCASCNGAAACGLFSEAALAASGALSPHVYARYRGSLVELERHAAATAAERAAREEERAAHAAEMRQLREKGAAVEARRREEAASRRYLAANTRSCPRCGRAIEKVEGCDVMVCGKDADGVGRGPDGRLVGCGAKFFWSQARAPVLAAAAVEE